MTTGSNFDESAAIGNFWTDTIYPREFKDGSGKFLNIVTEENGDTSVEYYPPFPSRNRIKLTVTFVRASGDIKEVTLKKFKQLTAKGISRWEEQYWGPESPMSFTHFTFEKLLAFLKLITELDLANLNQRRVALRDGGSDGFDPETRSKMETLLRLPDGVAMVDALLRNGSITSHDLVNVGFRKNQLEVFRRHLRETGFLATYRAEEGIKSTQPEKIWQHFLEKNEWIFGLGLDYRFLGVLQREAQVGDADLAGRDGAIADYLMTATHFTVLVEMKTPSTELFEARRNRAGAWKLSAALIDSVSQILEQKAAWQVEGEEAAGFDRAGTFHKQRAADPKCILLVGSDAQFCGSDKERAIKLRTFELFRRDSRNVEILTYDELYERASFIVGHSTPPSAETVSDHDDIPPF
jgi:hypothetical protein